MLCAGKCSKWRWSSSRGWLSLSGADMAPVSDPPARPSPASMGPGTASVVDAVSECGAPSPSGSALPARPSLPVEWRVGRGRRTSLPGAHVTPKPSAAGALPPRSAAVDGASAALLRAARDGPMPAEPRALVVGAPSGPPNGRARAGPGRPRPPPGVPRAPPTAGFATPPPPVLPPSRLGRSLVPPAHSRDASSRCRATALTGGPGRG
jgi:hypothetical protein